jgi:dephospho-CoA kinase
MDPYSFSRSPEPPTAEELKELEHVEIRHVVGLTGAAYSGKSTAEKYLADNYNFLGLSFAGPLKESCIVKYGIPRENCYDPKLKEVIIPEWGVSARKILQIEGTEMTRMELPKHIPSASDFWVKRLLVEINKRPFDDIVVSDVRFDNEVDALHKIGATIIKIERGEQKEATHASEKGISNPDFVLKNNGTIDEFYSNLQDVILAAGIKY